MYYTDIFPVLICRLNLYTLVFYIMDAGVTMAKIILMIDDDINLVDVVKMVLEAKEYLFFAAHSAVEGLEKIKECNPDLILPRFLPHVY